ncbi:MAG: hypothetical protein N2C12_00375, partial [Planctomycetales bacterium]
ELQSSELIFAGQGQSIAILGFLALLLRREIIYFSLILPRMGLKDAQRPVYTPGPTTTARPTPLATTSNVHPTL